MAYSLEIHWSYFHSSSGDFTALISLHRVFPASKSPTEVETREP